MRRALVLALVVMTGLYVQAAGVLERQKVNNRASVAAVEQCAARLNEAEHALRDLLPKHLQRRDGPFRRA